MGGPKVPAVMQGASLQPLLDGDRQKWRDEFYSEHPFEPRAIATRQAVRTERWKYMRYPEHDTETLFDLKNDPQEVRDLSGDPKHRKRLTALRSRCDILGQQVRGG